MKIIFRRISLWFITIVIGLIAVVVSYRLYASMQMGSKYIFHLWGLAVAFCFAVLQQLFSPAFSLLALKSVRNPTRYFPILWISMFSTSTNSTVPFPAGIPIRAALQKKILKITYTSSASAILIETVIAYGCELVAGIVSGIIWLRPAIKQQISVFKGPLMVGAILIGVLLTLTLVYLVARRFRGRLMEHIRNSGNLIASAKIAALTGMVLIVIVTYALFLLRMSFVLYSLGVSIPSGPLFAAMVFAHLSGVISFVPMGLGVRDISLASLLIILGVPIEHAAAAVAIDRVFITLPFLIGGVLATHILGRDLLDISKSQ